jgi:hypothetical protein
MTTGVYFDTNALYITDMRDAFVAGTLVCERDGDLISICRANEGSRVLQRPFQMIVRKDGSGFASAIEAQSYLDDEFAKRRPIITPSAEAVASASILAGMPVAISRRDGSLIPARADTYYEAFVAGLALADVEAGFVGTATREQLTLSDWTDVTGTASLLTGQPYFLAPQGGLTLSPSYTQGFCVVRVGNAVSSQMLTPIQSDPILT